MRVNRYNNDQINNPDFKEGQPRGEADNHADTDSIRGAPSGGMTGPLVEVDTCVLKTHKKKTGKFPRRIWQNRVF